MGIGGLLRLGEENNVFFYPVIWLLCGLFVILRGGITHLVGIEWVDIDLIPIFLIYLIAKDQDFRAGLLAFFMGILTDIFAPCQLGLFAFAYSAIVLGIIYCRRFLDFTKMRTSILLVAPFLVAKWSLLLAVLRIFPLAQSIPSITFPLVSISALMTSMIAPFLLRLLDLIGGGEHRGHGTAFRF
jgi:cell shape-determining protein MreD